MSCVKALATLSQTRPTVLAKTKALQLSPGEYHVLGMFMMPKSYAVTCRA
jgi:copper(I)-binding protein